MAICSMRIPAPQVAARRLMASARSASFNAGCRLVWDLQATYLSQSGGQKLYSLQTENREPALTAIYVQLDCLPTYLHACMHAMEVALRSYIGYKLLLPAYSMYVISGYVYTYTYAVDTLLPFGPHGTSGTMWNGHPASSLPQWAGAAARGAEDRPVCGIALFNARASFQTMTWNGVRRGLL